MRLKYFNAKKYHVIDFDNLGIIPKLILISISKFRSSCVLKFIISKESSTKIYQFQT